MTNKFAASITVIRRIAVAVGTTLVLGLSSVSAQEQTVTITEIDFVGNTLVGDADLNKRFTNYFNRDLTFNELNELVSLVGFAYRESGYWAAAYLPEQTISGSSLKIGIIESKTGDFAVEFETQRSRIKYEDLFEIIMRDQIQGAPMNIRSLEYGIKKANSIPGIFVAAELDEGEGANDTDVKAYVLDSPVFTGSIVVDNHLGGDHPRRLGARLGFDSPMGYGEQFNLNLEKSYQSNSISLTSSLGIFEERARAGLELGLNDYQIVGDLADLGLNGDVKTASFRLANIDVDPGNVDSPNLEISYSISKAEDFALGAKTGSKTTNLLKVDLDLPVFTDTNDNSFFNLKLTGGIGALDYGQGSDIYLRDQASQKAHGDFAKLNLGISTQKALSENSFIGLEINGQVASKNLDGSQKLTMSGATALQSLDSGSLSVDTGIWGKLKFMHNFEDGPQLYGFIEGGKGNLNHQTWANWNGGNAILQNSVHAYGGGLGVNVPINDNFSLELVAAKSIDTNLSEQSHSTNYWVELTYNF